MTKGSQFLIATHSPILLAYPGATLYELGRSFEQVSYAACRTTQIYRDFMDDPQPFVDQALGVERED